VFRKRGVGEAGCGVRGADCGVNKNKSKKLKNNNNNKTANIKQYKNKRK